MQQNPEPLWTPAAEFAEDSNLSHYIKWLSDSKGTDLNDYQDLWEWSVRNIPEFWSGLLEYFNIEYSGEYQQVLQGEAMPGINWPTEPEREKIEEFHRQLNELKEWLLEEPDFSRALLGHPWSFFSKL